MVNGNSILWAFKELQHLELGDSRRAWRGRMILSGLAANVGVCMSSSCGPGSAQLVSRFFSKKEVTLEKILKSHYLETAKRCASIDVDYFIVPQDTTTLSYNGQRKMEGLGKSGKGDQMGVLLHDALILTPDKTPLGLAFVKAWTRNSDESEDKINYRRKKMEEKESVKWKECLINAEKMIPADKKMIVVSDRESDVFEYFSMSRRENTEILVRMAYSVRSIEDEGFEKLEEKIRESPAEEKIHEIYVPPAKDRKARNAQLEIKFFEVNVKKPVDRRKDKDLPDFTKLSCVVAKEINVPDDVTEPIYWVLLSSMPVKTFDDAIFSLKTYSSRWVIEEYHKVLKSGANAEKLQFSSIESQLPAIGMLCLVAWRVLYITKYAREFPEAPAEQIFTNTEILVLEVWSAAQKKKKFRKIKTISDFVLFLAFLGGFYGRKCDGSPGTKVIWQGLRKLEIMVEYNSILENLKS